MEKTIIDKLAWIYIKDKKLLATRTRGKTVCFLPGGKREPGESDIQALTREIKEELSIDLVESSIKPFIVYEAPAYGKSEGVFVREACYTADFIGDLKPAAEVEDICWLSYADRENSIVTPAGKIILDDLRKRKLIE